ncbi:hypothetical protein [Kitasatospora sp. NPDC057223]|uniref:hypothetical protein n=1 Tax=Kitasatospora sp. NPDC057223 TaxID=3346055 RepID=UPI003644C273
MYFHLSVLAGRFALGTGIKERALNEILGNTVGRVEIGLTADGGVRVEDDGTGLPVGYAGHGDGPALESQLTVLGSGAPPAGRRSLFGGFGAVGLAVVNALSSRLVAVVRRDGGCWVLEYERGVGGVTPAGTGPAVVTPANVGPVGGSGTVVPFGLMPGSSRRWSSRSARWRGGSEK